MNKVKFKYVSLFAIVGFAAALLYGLSPALAATSPTLGESGLYSVLGGAAVNCNVASTTTGRVGVSPGTSITGFPVPCTAGGGTQINNTSAINAQADISTSGTGVFDVLNQACDLSFGAVDLTTTNFAPFGGVGTVGPGVFCSTSSFSLSGNLTLTGSGTHIFKTVSTLITSSNSSVTGGDPCNVWWRIGSAATLGSNTSFIGNIVTANVADTTALNSGATLNGRVLAQAAATVVLNGNTISGPVCAAPPTTTTTTSPPGSTTTTTSPPGSTTTTTVPGQTTTTTVPGQTTTTIGPPGAKIPAVGNWGMVTLALAFLGAIAWMVRARRSLR